MNEVGLTKTELDTPFLWVDLHRLEQNIEALAAHLQKAGVQWRPHIKGIKVPAIAHKMLKAGAIGVTCAKLSEAEVMAAAGIDDILIANQVVGEAKGRRLAQLCRTCDVKVAVDSVENVAMLGEAALASGVSIGVLVEVDVGMKRAGVPPGDPAVQLSRCVQETPGLRYLGLMGWEGHAITITDPVTRKEVVHEALNRLLTTADQCRSSGLAVEVISAGGSATLDTAPFVPGITEIQAGGAIFCDVYYHEMQSITAPALFVRSAVVSRPAVDRLIFDAGFKALPPWKRLPRPLGLSDVVSIGLSAEHGVVVLQAANEGVRVGDAFDFVVGYGDQTVFLHDRLYGIREGIVEAVWEIQARGKLA